MFGVLVLLLRSNDAGGCVQVIKALHSLVSQDKDNQSAKDVTALMYDTASLTSGFDVASPKQYASQVYGLMGMALQSEGDVPSQKAEGAASSTVEADQVIEEK